MEYIGYIAALLIGFSLGLIGSGGSILTVPLLVYLFKIDPDNATSYSLFIVGLTALTGSFRHYKLGNLKPETALYFAVPSLVSLLLIRKLLLPVLPESLFFAGSFEITKSLLIMLVFAVLMIAASVSMIRKSNTDVSGAMIDLRRLSAIGFLVGIVTGFLGAGGGFLIIPALLFFARLGMKQAVGTSLLIIAINSLIGFGGDVIGGTELNYIFLGTISAISIIGMLAGVTVSKRVDGAKLKPAFGWFVLAMGIYIMVKELFIS